MSTTGNRRPAPRRSSLAGQSPVAPPSAPEPAPTIEPPASTFSEPQAAAQQVGKEAEKKPKTRPKVSFYQDRADTDRVRGAILHTMASEGPRSLSQFIDSAVMREVERLEAKHNNGQPFPPVGARELPQGRPMGE